MFSDTLQARGLRAKYEEVFDIEAFTYTVSIRRDFQSVEAKAQRIVERLEGHLVQSC